MNIKWGSFEFGFEPSPMMLFVMVIGCGFFTMVVAIIYQ